MAAIFNAIAGRYVTGGAAMYRIRASHLPAWLQPTGLALVLAFVCLLPVIAQAGAFPTVIKPTGSANDWLGRSVASAGDFNGDGYGDIIVGRGYTSNGTQGGAALIYFGGPKMDDVADLTLRGEVPANNENFGWAVAGAGDVNNDGYDDVIVGAATCDLDGTDAGRAYVFYGGASPNAVADMTLSGEAAGDHFGCAVGTAGDVNDDGYDDVIVGALWSDAGGTNAGRAYVFLGGSHPNSVVDLTLTGVDPSDYFGCSVGTAGDMNGDGYADMIVGGYGSDVGGTSAGRAYVFYGGTTLNSKPDLTLTGSTGDYFGFSVSTAGDFNSDGYDDVVVGAYGNGKAYVFYGAAFGNATADLTLAGGSVADFGYSVAVVGYANNDHFPDIVVGAWGGVAGAYGGAAYLYYGGATPDAVADLALIGEASGDYYGWSVSSAGDVNSDGRDDLLVGANQNDAGGTNAGRVYLYDSGDPPPAANRSQWTIPGAAAGDVLGLSVGAAGDVNDDGFDDVIVGAEFNDAGGANAGRAYLLLGGAAADSVPDVTMTGAAAGDYFGQSVGTAGDVNGDGRDDWLVGGPRNDFAGTDAGRAYFFEGSVVPDGTADLVLNGAAASDFFGTSLGTAGDVNGDGYDDVIVGAPGAGTGGKAYVFFGGSTFNAVADWTLSAEAALDNFGQSVGTAGDVNGDGYDDVIVGANLNDDGGTSAGRAYVFYGGTSPNTVADLILTGETTGDYFGYAVGTAGDMNGDGYDDVIVGAYLNDAGGSNAGRAYVFHGGPDADGVADLVLTGEAAGDAFGCSVGTAGDVNLDGCSDVIVGARLNGAGGTDAGRAYVYYGGQPDTTADVTYTGAVAYDDFGYSVGTAGDTRGDGVPDVIVGAPYSDGGGGSSGGAYVHDFNRYFVTLPNGGETWAQGATQSVTWMGAERADLWLSLNDGADYELLKEDVGGMVSNTTTVTVPAVTSDLALVKVVPREVWIAGSDSSDAVFTILGPTGVGSESLALKFRAPWPNPASGMVRFGIELASPAVVTVSVLDVAGREVARPIAGERFTAGRVTREWRPQGLAPGVYAVRAEVGERKVTRRLVWLGGK
jgi:hypothetical protein